MADIARAAGVSPATVDRVLNRRKGVKEGTVARVLREAAALGYLSEREYERLARPRPLNIVFLLPKGTNPYLQLLGRKVRAIADSKLKEDAKIRCFFIDSFNAKALASALRRHSGWADGIAFMAIDHPAVREAVEELAAGGKQTVAVVSDLSSSSRTAYVGLDNQAAGRTAGYLMGRFSRAPGGSVALVAGSRIYRAHAEREIGFLGLLEEMYPELRVVGVREGHDDPDENYRHALAILEQNPDLVGIYNVGGSSYGIGKALQQRKRVPGVIFIGHGLTPDTRALLIDGTMDVVINSDPNAILSTALQVFQKGRSDGPVATPNIAPVTMDIVFRENLPYAPPT
ncbi:MAG: LacI family DNA-binding transcriptional regulator [Gammaproteobacteria bacterium]